MFVEQGVHNFPDDVIVSIKRAKAESIQLTLEQSLTQKRKYDKNDPKQKQFDTNIIYCFAGDGLPFDTVEKPCFLKLVSDLNSRITVSSRKTYMTRMEEMVTKEIIPKLTEEVKSVEKRFCHFSCDIWNSRKTEGIFCVLAHYINESFELKKKVILYEPLLEKHTGDYIRRVFLGSLKKFGINYDWVSAFNSYSANNDLGRCFMI